MSNGPVQVGGRGDGPPDFSGGPFEAWTAFLARHRIALTVALLLLGLVFSRLSAGVRWQADVLAFFSSQSTDVANMRAAAAAQGAASQLRLDLHMTGPGAGDRAAIVAATRAVASRLRGTGLFRQVWDGVEPARLATAYAGLIAQAPILLTDAQRDQLDARMTPDALAARFRQVRNRLADPDGEILARQLQADPLGLSGLITEKLQFLSVGGGTDANITLDDGLLMTRIPEGRPDAGWHAMIVADPIAAPSDQTKAQAVVDGADAAVAAVQAQFPGLRSWLVGAHRGYVENAARVKTDVTRISLLGSLAVAAAIALFFRRLRAALLCIVPPMVGVGITLGLAGLAHVELPLLLLGFAGLLCGSTTDYGIQILAECRRLAERWGGWHAAIPATAAVRLAGPITMSVATSVTGFAALGLSAAPGLRALGLFVAAATLAIWVITFLILPAYLGPWVLSKNQESRIRKTEGLPAKASIGKASFLILVSCLLILVPLIPAAAVRFNPDPHRLDGSSPQLLADEAGFYRTWGDIRNRAIVLVSAPTAGDALTAQERVADYLADLQRDGRIAAVTTDADLLPAPGTAAERAAAWNTYWTADRRQVLRQRLADAARAAGFAPAAFASYADRLADAAPPAPREQLDTSPAALFPGFITRSPGNVTLAAIVQMNPQPETSLRLATAWAKELRLRFDQVSGMRPPVILSGNVLIFDATDRARAEGERFAPWCLLAILLPLWIYFAFRRRPGGGLWRGLRRAWLALSCLLVGFLWVLGAAQVFGGGLNVLSLVPILFTLGVAIDYGIYAASDPALQSPDPAQNRLAATGLCALTTILGSGSLILAVHPALRWLGITLVAGIAGGYLASLLLVAPAVRWASRPHPPRPRFRRSLAFAARFALTAVLLIVTVLLMLPPFFEWRLARERPAVVTDPGSAPLRQTARRTFTVGRSWMRYRATSPDAGLWEIALAGTPAQRGRAVSMLACPLDCRIESEMLDQLDTLLPSEWSRWLILRAVGIDMAWLPAYVPLEDQQEIYAASQSYTDPHAYLAPTYSRILSYHALHDVSQMLIDNPLIVPNTFACTGVVSLPAYTGGDGPSAGHLLLGRDFDFEGGESFGRQKSLTYVLPPPGEGIPYAHVAWPGLEGCVTGINRERIALFINAAATRSFRPIGTPTILMAREILEQARSLDDAQRIIEGTSVFVSDIIVVADGKTGRARVFEKSPAATAFYDVNQSLAVTNHLVTPTFADDPVNRQRITDSTTMQRWRRARELLDQMHGHVTPDALAGLLRDKKGLGGKDLGFGNRNAIDGLIACHSVIIDATAGRLWVAGWPNAEGAYVGVDVLAMLDHAQDPDGPPPPASASPSSIGADRIMTDGTWARIEAGRRAALAAVDAHGRRDVQAELAEAQLVIDNNPAFYLGHALKGQALLAGGRLADARIELQKALDADPPYASRRAALQALLLQCDRR